MSNGIPWWISSGHEPEPRVIDHFKAEKHRPKKRSKFMSLEELESLRQRLGIEQDDLRNAVRISDKCRQNVGG